MLRIALVALVATPFAAAAGGTAAARSCVPTASRVGVALPAAVTVTTECGIFEIARDGRVRLLSRNASPVPKQAFAYWATGIWEGRADGHLVVGRWRRTLWRSHGRYTGRHALYNLSNAVLGPHSLAYARGFPKQLLYVAPFGGRERLVARGEYPIGWTSAGFYAWGPPHHRLLLRGATGRLQKTIAPSAFTYAYADRALWLIRNGILLRADGPLIRSVAALRPLGLWPARHLQLLPLGRLVALETGRRLVVLRADGSLFASTDLTYGSAQVDGVSAPPVANRAGSEVAFATSRGDTGYASHGTETIWVLQAHDRGARPVRVERVVWGTCISGAELSWRGGWLLYSSNGGKVALVAALSGREIGLTPLVQSLPGVGGGSGLDASVSWA